MSLFAESIWRALPPPLEILKSSQVSEGSRSGDRIVTERHHATSLAATLSNNYLPLRLATKVVMTTSEGSKRVDEIQRVFAELTSALQGFDRAILCVNDHIRKIDKDMKVQECGSSWSRPAKVQLLYPLTEGQCTKHAACSVSVSSKTTTSIQCALLHIDVLCYAPNDWLVSRAVRELVLPGMIRQLEEMEHQTILSGKGAVSLQGYHYLVPELRHHLTLVHQVPEDDNPQVEEPKLKQQRAWWHKTFNLSADRPLFRVANALSFSETHADLKALKLLNVHEGLSASNLGGSIHVVKGLYRYHHYKHDNFDDSGWGCAYRSLQTIWSWFQEQNYTCLAPPSHAEIQKTLVMRGERGTDLLNSKQWIGAIEIGCVLNELLGIEYGIIDVPPSSDVSACARRIASHFDSFGTPIMIGGGVLAYTLLGIEWREDTGECCFLILDPHYKGEDSLYAIQNGGWVAWKKVSDNATAGGPLFVPGAHYNLMCPWPTSGV